MNINILSIILNQKDNFPLSFLDLKLQNEPTIAFRFHISTTS